MQEIIAPIAKSVLESELTADKFIRDTNNGENKIYIITHHDSPNVMSEIGRLREFTFRSAGGGTGAKTVPGGAATGESSLDCLLGWVAGRIAHAWSFKRLSGRGVRPLCHVAAPRALDAGEPAAAYRRGRDWGPRAGGENRTAGNQVGDGRTAGRQTSPSEPYPIERTARVVNEGVTVSLGAAAGAVSESVERVAQTGRRTAY